MALFKSLEVLCQIFNRRLLIFPIFGLISELMVTYHLFYLGVWPSVRFFSWPPSWALDSHGLYPLLLWRFLKLFIRTICKVKNPPIIFSNLSFILGIRNIHHWFWVVQLSFIDSSHSFKWSDWKWIFLFDTHARNVQNRQMAGAWLFRILESERFVSIWWPYLL